MQIQVIGLNLAVRFEPLGFKNFEEAECQRREKCVSFYAMQNRVRNVYMPLGQRCKDVDICESASGGKQEKTNTT